MDGATRVYFDPGLSNHLRIVLSGGGCFKCQRCLFHNSRDGFESGSELCKRIAGILDEADRVRKKTQALIDKYDELAQSLFLDMFGDPVTNPKGWEVKPFGG